MLDGARAYRLEDRTGSIEIGKTADLIVLNQNLFEIPIENVSEAMVLMTLFEGRLVYSADDQDPSCVLRGLCGRFA